MAHANCKGCENRFVGCHHNCSDYRDFRAKQDALLKAKNLSKEADAMEIQRRIDKKLCMRGKRKQVGNKC